MMELVDLYYFNGLVNMGEENKGVRIGLLLLPIIDQKQYSMGNLPYLLLTLPKYYQLIGSQDDDGVNTGKACIEFISEVFTYIFYPEEN
jgi:hypothetical protein